MAKVKKMAFGGMSAMRGPSRAPAPPPPAPAQRAPAPQAQFMNKLMGGQPQSNPGMPAGTPVGAPPQGGLAGMASKFGPPQGSPGMPVGTRMGGMGMKKGGSVSSASKRADGIAMRGKTKGRFV